MLLLGVVQAQAFEAATAGSFDLLQTEILTGSQASVTFSDLGDYATAGYQHLQIRYAVRSTRSQVNSGINLRFNADTGTNYIIHGLVGSGSSVSSYSSTGRSNTGGLPIPAANATASAFGGGVYDLLDPFETTKYTTVRGLGGIASSFNELQLASGLWLNTAALSSIIFVEPNSAEFATGSRFSLYGIRGA